MQLVNAAKPAPSSSGLYGAKKSLEVPKTRTAFNEAASEVAKGVHKTSALLTKLTNLVRRQGLFDDPTEEINTLIFRIKQDLDDLNSKCDAAQQYVDGKKSMFGDVNQSAAHNVKVVSHLKTDLMHTTKDFKSVLEMRSSKMKDQQVRKVELTGKGVLSPMRAIAAREQQQQKAADGNGSRGVSFGADTANGNGGLAHRPPQRSKLPSPYGNQLYGDYNNNNNSSSNQFGGDVETPSEHQQLLLDPIGAESQYFDARERAVTEVERTIGELGSLFNRLATMISEQQELVERVDEDVEAATENATRAQDILMRTYERVSSNSGMYMKLGAILGIFLLFFVLFLM
jgi:syntaxin 5